MGKVGIKTNSLWSIGNYGLSVASLFFLFPFMVHHLGASNYGFFIFLGTINGMASIANFGFGEASLRFIAFYHNNHDNKSLTNIISTSFWTYLVLGSFTTLGIILLAKPIVGLLKATEIDISLAVRLVNISALTFMVRFILGIFGTIPQALQRFDVSSRISILETILRLSFYLVVLFAGFGLTGVVISELLLSIIIAFTNFYFSTRLLDTFNLIGKPSSSTFKEIFNYSIITFITQMVGLLWQYTDRILLGYFIGSAAIAYFSVPQQIIFKILGLVTAASVVLFPRFSINHLDELSKELYKEFTLISLLFTIVAFSTLSFIIKDFMALWISPSFAAETKNIAIILAISCMIRGAFPIYENLFKGIGKPIYNMYIIIASSLIIVILDFILIPVLGLNGAGIAYMVSPLAGIVAVIFIWRKLLRAPLSEPFRIYLIPLLISYFILAISFLIKRRIMFTPSWLIIITQAVVFLVFQVSLLFGYYKLFAPEVLVKLDDLKKRTKSIWQPI